MKSTKHTLLKSLLALLLCFSILLGTTYAWFTDSVSSVDNIIKSGNLDIAMYWAEDLSGNAWKNVEDEDNADNQKIFNYDKWEPGYTEVRHIKIENKGTLAFKYVLDIVPLGEVSILAEVIDVYFLDPAQELGERADLPLEARVGTLADVIAGRLPFWASLRSMATRLSLPSHSRCVRMLVTSIRGFLLVTPSPFSSLHRSWHMKATPLAPTMTPRQSSPSFPLTRRRLPG